MIADMIPKRVAYTQLAEECTELAHAALKLGRKADPEQCYVMGKADADRWLLNLYEEMADVLVCMDVVLKFREKGAMEHIDEIRREKMARWEKRLESEGRVNHEPG